MATATDERVDFVRLVTEPIDVGALAESVRADAAGAIAVFAGVVRDHHLGVRVKSLEYEAYAPMAESEIRRIVADLRSRWKVERVAIAHRTGHLEVGETSVAIAISSGHRREALEACAWAIDRIKESVPVWKKEHGERGGVWVLGDDSPRAASRGAVPIMERSSRRRAEA